MAERLDLPDILEPYRAQIEATVRPCVRITPTLDAHTGPLDSKFGGYPYLPVGMEYPKDEDGKPMVLLAQINFAEVPHIDPYPEKGILQIYIQANADNWDNFGCDSWDETKQKNWRILWFREPDGRTAMTDFFFLAEDDILWSGTPFVFDGRGSRGKALHMSFEIIHQPLPLSDRRSTPLFLYPETVQEMLNRCNSDPELSRLLLRHEEMWGISSHQIGGYPVFTQDDPRSEIRFEEKLGPESFKSTVLLLQIVSDSFIEWIDMGIANFLIRVEDLINQDFSNVFYHWDCY